MGGGGRIEESMRGVRKDSAAKKREGEEEGEEREKNFT